MNINTFDLNLLRVFSAIYGERNVSRAALRVGITQPAISNALLRLRKTCGDPLFVRTSAGMEPTALAEELHGPVDQALSILRASFEQPTRFDPTTSERAFRLLMSDAGESAILPRLMAEPQALAPGISIEVLQIPHGDYARVLEEGGADLAFGNLPFLKGSFFQQRLFSDPYFCIANHQHPRVKAGQLTLADYLRCAHIQVSAGNADALVEQALTQKKKHRSIQLRLGNYHVAGEIVSKTPLLATVPLKVVTDKVQAVPLPFRIPQAEVRQFWHRRAHHDPANQWLRGVLAKMFDAKPKAGKTGIA